MGKTSIDKILNITWEEPLTYNEIAERTGLTYHQVRSAILKHNEKSEFQIIVKKRNYENLEHLSHEEIKERIRRQKREWARNKVRNK